MDSAISTMFYIHKSSCISPQQTFSSIDLEKPVESSCNQLLAIEPDYHGIPVGMLRRMGKAVRIGVGAALPLIKEKFDGIVIGTANGGMEDCIKFLNQIIDYDEGRLTPTNFVQSTANAVASQLAMMSTNKGYNITHVHRGHSFENAMLDVIILLHENPEHAYLLGGLEEISNHNHNIETLAGWYKKETVSNAQIYESNTEGALPGEGAAIFLVNKIENNAIAKLLAMKTINTADENAVAEQLQFFLKENLTDGKRVDLFLSGENGDNRLLKYYLSCEKVLTGKIPVARFKHLCGEYQTATAFALWLCSYILQNQLLPQHLLKSGTPQGNINNILIYNNYKKTQHSFMLVSNI
jgi:hypothetical protein